MRGAIIGGMDTADTGSAPVVGAGPADEDPVGSVLEQALRRGERGADDGALESVLVSAWNDAAGILADGRAARQAASCLLRPVPGDLVLIWSPATGPGWVLGILERAGENETAVLAVPGSLAIEAPRVGIAAHSVHVVAEDLLTSVRNHHAVTHTHTETSDVRVAQIGTDIRRATTADDAVEGTFLQRTGTWISNTVRDARLRARTFLFD